DPVLDRPRVLGSPQRDLGGVRRLGDVDRTRTIGTARCPRVSEPPWDGKLVQTVTEGGPGRGSDRLLRTRGSGRTHDRPETVSGSFASHFTARGRTPVGSPARRTSRTGPTLRCRHGAEIGRASCRERVYVTVGVVTSEQKR